MLIIGDVAWLLVIPAAFLVRNAPAQVGGFQLGNRVVEQPVLFVEQRAVAFPRRVIPPVRKRQPV